MNRFIISIVFMAARVLFAQSEIGDTADRLSSKADRFSRLAQTTRGYTQLANDGDRMRSDVDQLRTLADRGASERELQQEFRYVEDDYYYLHRGFDEARAATPDQFMDRAWTDVDFSYRDLTRAMQSGGSCRVSLNCSSSRYRFQQCDVNGSIQNVQLTQQQSSTPCQYGSSWGYYERAVWVDRGCRANFLVTLRR